MAPVAVSLAEAYAQPRVAWPRLVYDGEQLVGFVMGAFDPHCPARGSGNYLPSRKVDATFQVGKYCPPRHGGARWPTKYAPMRPPGP